MADETTPSDDGVLNDEEAGSEVSETLAAAIETVRADPEDEESWDRLEDEAASVQRPDEVAALFKEVLNDEISVELANDLGQRATNFLEEWYGEESKALTQVLSRVLEIDRACDWAFQRLTVAYTVSGRWDELMSLYDEAIEATEDADQKQAYLDEAVNVAKDFAQEPDRAIGYLQQLLVLFPSDRRRMVPLERLLRKQERWQDLVDLWGSRLEFLQIDEALEQRVLIATNCLDKLAAPEPALLQIEEVVKTDKGDRDKIIEVLERVSRWDSASTEVRRRSLVLLKAQYEAADNTSEVVRVIETMLDFATSEETADLHREAGERLIALERHERAMPHFASLLRLVPTAVDAYQRLRELAGRTGNSLAFAEALEEAAAACEQAETRVTLRLEAAKTRRMVLDDLDGAIVLYFEVLEETEVKAAASLQACRQLNAMLEAEGRNEEQLDVLERLAGEEPETSERRDVLGRAARLADTLGETDRALVLWDKRIEEDENDIEALSSSVSLLKRESRWEPLIEALLKRSKAPVSRRQSREDLVMVARLRAEKLGDINAAIETWSEIRESFGEDEETTNALADLFAQSNRWDEYATLLDGAAERESTHISSILARLGDVCRDQLSEPDRAINFFRRSLRIDPGQADAIVGLRRMLEDRPERRGEVANILAAAYEVTEKWDRVLELLEHRLEVAKTSVAQARLLRETATIQEQQLANNSGALRSLCRALVLTPWDDSLEAEILRFGEDTQEWRLVVESFNEAGEAALEEVRRLHLKFEAGRLAEEHLEDPMVALDAYLAVLLRAPTRIDAALAVVRSAGSAGRWDRVAEAMLLCTSACEEFVPSVVEAMESSAGQAGDWSTLSNALEGALGVDEELSPALARQVDQLVAYWHEERRQDLDAAEAALKRAVAREGDDEGALRSLAKLQRANPGRELYDTLTTLGDIRLSENDLDPLHEAAKLALETIRDDDLTKEALRRLYREASRLWRRNITATGEGTAEGLARWGIDELAELFINEEDYARAVALLNDGAQLPLIDAAAREMRRRAASLAAGPMGDNQRALVLYRSLVADTPDDEETLREFSNVCRASGLDLELLSLLKRELTLCHEHDRRLDLRLEISQLIGKFENLGGRLDVLTDNLHEHPGHGPSIDALIVVHEDTGRFAELADLLTSQAKLLQKKKKTERAAGLWRKIATLSEERLGDKERAIQGYRRVQKLVGSVESLDALARLQAERGEHASAARWLERRLQLTEGEERLGICKQLATAYLADGQISEATTRLEAALELEPKARDVREHLATLYRDHKEWEPLAKLLTEAAPHVDDLETLRAYAHEAAELYSQLGSPDRSITVLEKASSLAPDDRSLRRMLAEGLIAAERLEEATSILEDLIGSYGRRRNPERAGAHFMLAKALKAQGDLDAALEQLDLAAKMDVRNPQIAALLGRLAVEAGQLERAERTYRALLMVVRRQPPTDEQSMGAAEVLFELYNLAKKSDKDEQAQELLRSVLQTASQSAAESRRFRRAMVDRGQEELVLEALQLRVKSAEPGEELAKALNDLAEGLETNPDQRGEALDARFKALEQAPDAWDIHAAARKLALELDRSKRYVKTLQRLIKNVRRKEETTVASLLLQRLGQSLEEDLSDYDGATKAYGKVESLGHHEVEARVSLARVAGARGDRDEEVRLLKALVADDSLVESARSDSRYRLAELQLEAPEKSAEGLATLEDALECDAFYQRAAEILRVATSISDDPERLALYGRVARAAAEDGVLLDYLEKRLKRFDAELDEAKQAVDLLQQMEGETARLRTALRRAVEIAELTDEGIGGALWAPTGLANVYYQTENLARSASWLAKAAEASVDENQAFELWLSAAARAAEGDDHTQAVEIYERLLEGDASNRKIWQPALESARALGDEERVTALVNNTLTVLSEVSGRNAVRIQHAMFLLSLDAREPEAVEVLQAVLIEEPGQAEATELLTKLYERIGYDEHLSALLRSQLDVARDNQDLDQILELSLKLGDLMVKIRREDAMDVYRRALEWLPDNRDLATHLLELLGPDDDPRERVELMERPLKNERGEDAARLALQLADEWQTLFEESAVERVLKLGYEVCPEDEALRQRLETWFSDRGDWQSLSSLMVSEATRLADAVTSVTLLRSAASIYRDSLNYQEGAVQCLAQARTYAADDLDLLSELVEHRKALGDFQTPQIEVSEVLERFDSSHPSRADLLSLRAGLTSAVGNIDAAVADLEEAYGLESSSVAPHLVDGLEQQRAVAAAQGDVESERIATLRLVAVLLENGDRQRARETLGQWLDRSPQDRDALYHLLQLGEEEEQWQAVAETCERLVALEEGEEQVDMVIRLAEACDRTGIPENARAGLEHVYQEQPTVVEVRDRLWSLYETIGARLELATMLVAEALANEDQEEKFSQLHRAGTLFLEAGDGGVDQAIAPLEEAVQIKPDDHGTTIMLIDAYTSTNRFAEAGKLLEQAIAARGSRRSPQLAELQYRMARLAAVAGDKQLQLQWLNVAFDSDRRNGDVVADLAHLAMELGELDLALSALRVITVSKVESSLSRAAAFLMQAKIAHKRGEQRRALMWAHRAHEEDAELVEAAELLEKLGGGS